MGNLLEQDCSIAAAGDAAISRRLSVFNQDRFEPLINELRSADIAAVNLETLLLDPEDEGYPASTDVSVPLQTHSPPWVVEELEWLGFNLFAAASNHSNDYSHGGMLATMRNLESRDAAYAGLGRDRSSARAPCYTDTEAGRGALVAACASFQPGSEAGHQRHDMRGRPGISPLQIDTRFQLPDEELDSLRNISEQLGIEEEKRRRREAGFLDQDGDDEFRFLSDGYRPDLMFEASNEPGIEQTANQDDVSAICRQIKRAKTHADWVIASLHIHQGRGLGYNDATVPTVLESFARTCIDAGADVFFGHGPHQLRGIEIYEGAPIFYSLGNFVLQGETTPRYGQDVYDAMGIGSREALSSDIHRDGPGLPMNESVMDDPAFWESVVPICRFVDGDLDEIKLYPVDLGYELPRTQRGYPLPARREAASDVIERIAKFSSPYGTDVVFQDGIGLVDF